ncbi:related to peroxisomal membrane protein 20 [Ceraceosorus bombacis]|uniref:Related to peroxisomal membrane protein 20 n=1 Tax=Ceraceosorus bombacis TaxID=401625 RepID=A0A0P1BLX9_9BASI|nr:related to peroxisomal membrane protein 20 [Ceraceosorus bombacis]
MAATAAAIIKGAVNPLKQGSKVATGVQLKETNPTEANVSLDTLTGKNIILGVPGAFTPPCSSQVPGYLQHADQFLAKGVKGIYIVAVNDLFTVQAWKEKLGASNPAIHFLADDTGAFTRSAGLDFDASGLLGNQRSQRYVAIVEDGVVKHLAKEDEAPNVTVTAADKVLAQV